ncbi:MAG: hypothetical protein ACT4QD_00655 [Acidobacteriota bacterium]
MASGSSDANGPEPGGEAVSPAKARFLSCRWRKAAEEGVPDHCTHRDVLPIAGTTGFVPESWCPDCSYYKARRTPRKRQDEEPSDSWRW